jgi:hypothetical protein
LPLVFLSPNSFNDDRDTASTGKRGLAEDQEPGLGAAIGVSAALALYRAGGNPRFHVAAPTLWARRRPSLSDKHPTAPELHCKRW